MQRVVAAACSRDTLFAIHENTEGACCVSVVEPQNSQQTAAILRGNDSYSALAVDAEGKLWVVSRSGHVYTEARLLAAEPVAAELDAELEPGRFSLTALPGSKACSYSDGATALWLEPGGTAFIGAFDGTVHVTAGRSWHRLELGSKSEVHAIAGQHAADVWVAAGDDLFHYDGRAVEQVRLLRNEIDVQITGIVPVANARAWVSTAQGHVLECRRGGSASALFMPRLISSSSPGIFSQSLSHAWVGMGRVGAAVYLAGMTGVHRFDGDAPAAAEELAITPRALFSGHHALTIVDKARRKEGRVACARGEPLAWSCFRFIA